MAYPTTERAFLNSRSIARVSRKVSTDQCKSRSRQDGTLHRVWIYFHVIIKRGKSRVKLRKKEVQFLQ